MRVLLAGGGSAGHTSPLLATADALQRLHPGVEITCLGTRERIEAQIIPAAGYPLEFVPSVPLPRRPNADLVRLPGRLRAARRAALDVVDRIRPDVIAGFGGFVSVPAYLAARTRKVPLVVHEGNTLPGVANKLGSTDHRPRRHQLPRHPAAPRDLPRAADPTDDRHARPGRPPRRGARDVRAARRPAGAARHRRLAGGGLDQPGGARLGPGRSPTPASRSSTSPARPTR